MSTGKTEMKTENTDVKNKTDPFSLIAFYLSIIFAIIGLLILYLTLNSAAKIIRPNPYTTQEILGYILTYSLLFIFPFVIVLILSIIGYKRTSKDSTLKGKGLALTAMIIAILSLIVALLMIGGQAIHMIGFQGSGESCVAKYGGTCVLADQCPSGAVTTLTECEAKGMVCCPVAR